MPHLPHRSFQMALKPSVVLKSPVAEEITPARIERHQGTTRAPRPRVLKPPLG